MILTYIAALSESSILKSKMLKRPGALKTAMLLDMSADWAMRYRALLASSGIELIEWIPSGAGWIAQWQKRRPSMTIVDLQLIKRDGIYCIEKIHALDQHHWTIFTHGYQGMMANAVEMKAMARGASSVLQKPFSETRFKIAIDRFKLHSQKIKSVSKIQLA